MTDRESLTLNLGLHQLNGRRRWGEVIDPGRGSAGFRPMEVGEKILPPRNLTYIPPQKKPYLKGTIISGYPC